MPHRDLLSTAQRSELLKLPTSLRQLEEFYTLTPADLDLTARRRSPQNRLGFAVQLCFLRYPGWAWTPEQTVPESMLRFIALQVGIAPEGLSLYAQRDETRREHMLELQTVYGWQNITRKLYREVTEWLREQARSTDQGVALATLLIGELRRRRIVVPTFPVLERLTLVARALARREAYRVLTKDLTDGQRTGLGRLLDARPESRQTQLGWLRQSIGAANPNNILRCIERLKFIRELGIPIEWAHRAVGSDCPRRGWNRCRSSAGVRRSTAPRHAGCGGARHVRAADG